jgi:hypothetical protein
MAKNSDPLGNALTQMTDPVAGAAMYVDMVFKGIPIGEVQRAELVKAFVGGTLWLLTTQLHVIAALPEDEAVLVQQGIYEKAKAFAMGLQDNGAGGMTDEPVVSSNNTKEG